MMKGKKLLRDRNEWITDDLIERERKIKWRLKKEANRRRGEGLSTGSVCEDVGRKKNYSYEMKLIEEMKDDLRISKREGLKREVSDGGKEGEESEERAVFR